MNNLLFALGICAVLLLALAWMIHHGQQEFAAEQATDRALDFALLRQLRRCSELRAKQPHAVAFMDLTDAMQAGMEALIQYDEPAMRRAIEVLHGFV